jgi:hypothetical protein
VKISKPEYAVLVYYKLESTHKKSSKSSKVMVQNPKKMSDLRWNASLLLSLLSLLLSLILSLSLLLPLFFFQNLFTIKTIMAGFN